MTGPSKNSHALHFTQLSGKKGFFELFCRFNAPGRNPSTGRPVNLRAVSGSVPMFLRN
jgi:hypothetical protein